MIVKIRFLGLLSFKYSAPIIVDLDPDYKSLHSKIQELIDNQGATNYVVLKNGKPWISTVPLESGDEFCVFTPISGG